MLASIKEEIVERKAKHWLEEKGTKRPRLIIAHSFEIDLGSLAALET